MGVENYENESWGEKPEDLALRNHMLWKQVKLIRKGLKQIKSMWMVMLLIRIMNCVGGGDAIYIDTKF